MRDALAENTAATGIVPVDTAYLGNGAGVVVVDTLTRRVNVWQPSQGGNARVVFTAILWTGSNIPLANIAASQLIPVDLGFPPNDQRLSVLWQNGPMGTAGANGKTLGEQKANSTAFPIAANIQDWRVKIQSGTPEVFIAEGIYKRESDDAVLKWYGGTTALADDTITDRISALTSGQHQVCWICFDKENGIPATEVSAAVSAVGSLPSRYEFLSPDSAFTVSTSYRKIVPVYLYYGQTEIVEADIYRSWDARFLI